MTSLPLCGPRFSDLRARPESHHSLTWEPDLVSEKRNSVSDKIYFHIWEHAKAVRDFLDQRPLPFCPQAKCCNLPSRSSSLHGKCPAPPIQGPGGTLSTAHACPERSFGHHPPSYSHQSTTPTGTYRTFGIRQEDCQEAESEDRAIDRRRDPMAATTSVFGSILA